jgi:regulator of sigma E protease
MLRFFGGFFMHQLFAFLAFLLGMLTLITVHEFGHFLAAKLTGMAAHTFSIGFGPSLFSKVIGQTEWKIGSLPFGGYVAIMGHGYSKEIAKEVVEQLKSDPRRSPESLGVLCDETNWHSSKSGWKQLLVALGGPLSNLLLASVIALVIFATHGVSVIASPLTVATVSPGTPAAAVLQSGDIVKKVCGYNAATFDDVLLALSSKQCEQTITVEVDRAGTSVQADIPALSASSNGIGFDVLRVRERPGFLPLIAESLRTPVEQAVLQLKGIKALLFGQASLSNLGGPIMIFSIGTAAASKGFWSLLSSLESFSVLLAVMNLLPLPGLDGFAALEAGAKMVSGSEMPEEQRGIWSLLKVTVILGLFIFAFWADVMRYIRPLFGG